METYIRYDQNTGIVTFIHHKPFDPVHGLGETRDELLKTGVFVEDFPAPEQKQGQRATAYYNPEQKKVYYEYELAPLSSAERFDMLEDVINTLLLSSLSAGGEDE